MLKKQERHIPYLFILPAFIGLFLFKIYPVIEAAISSFQISSFGGGIKWAGLSNYLFLFQDPVFWKSLGVTLQWSLIINPFQIIVALGLAVLVNRRIKGMNIIRTIYFLPMIVSQAVASIIWGLMLNPNSGLVNSILAAVGLSAQPFLVSSKQALLTIILIASWRSFGYWMTFFLAGLNEISLEVYEAAKIDGANQLQTFTRVTLPLLKRTLLFVAVADTSANFLIFVPMYVLTNGGPEMSTNVLMLEAYKNAFIYGDHNMAAAIVIILLILILMVMRLEMRLLRTE